LQMSLPPDEVARRMGRREGMPPLRASGAAVSRAVNSEAWRERAPTQRERILAALRRGDWVCSIIWHESGIWRPAARIWELRHEESHEIAEEICPDHQLARYRLVRDADEGL
jgi:hypothetical protein